LEVAIENRAAPAKLSLLALALGFMQVGLSSVGGAAAPIRYVLVVRRRWLSETELAETFSISQALPGASAANLAVIVGDRFAGPAGSLATLFGLCIPSLIIALVLATFATRLSASNVRFAAAEAAVTAAVGGLFISNGMRLAWRLWHAAPALRRRWRAGRLTISLAAVVLVAGLHVWIPAVLVLLAISGFVLERATRRHGRAA
jgi:chromate transport protein ChrA